MKCSYYLVLVFRKSFILLKNFSVPKQTQIDFFQILRKTNFYNLTILKQRFVVDFLN